MNFALMGGIILFMWLFVFRPQSKRAKEQKEFLSSLTPGIEVITAGGIIGTIVEVKENIVSINVGGSTMRVVKSSISGRLDASSSIPATK
ncbi:preprotein translocase subunit YajC [Silvanigrella aquatica]|uniref:Sec translocon accessory complex subunit YajC n=1 Tax=Silvanigrella aquatica TaxID=1915309 RepID=A0A1L4D4G1_9BACT|nr:preprotein translocase subunit YajC [Silvanigrella aquatica]